jgi:PAS domain-containing protein
VEKTSGVADRNPLAAVTHGHSLAEAIVDTVREPLVVLDRDLRVIAASRSFYQTFAAERQKTEGRMLYELGDGQWNIPALRTVLEDVIRKLRTVEAYGARIPNDRPTRDVFKILSACSILLSRTKTFRMNSFRDEHSPSERGLRCVGALPWSKLGSWCN